MYSQWQVPSRILKLIWLGYQAPVQLSKPRSTLHFNDLVAFYQNCANPCDLHCDLKIASISNQNNISFISFPKKCLCWSNMDVLAWVSHFIKSFSTNLAAKLNLARFWRQQTNADGFDPRFRTSDLHFSYMWIFLHTQSLQEWRAVYC